MLVRVYRCEVMVAAHGLSRPTFLLILSLDGSRATHQLFAAMSTSKKVAGLAEFSRRNRWLKVKRWRAVIKRLASGGPRGRAEVEKDLNLRAIGRMKIVSTTAMFKQRSLNVRAKIHMVNSCQPTIDATWKNLVMDYGADPAGLNVAATDRAWTTVAHSRASK